MNARPTVRVRMEITVFMVLFLYALGGANTKCVRADCERIKSSK